MLYRQKFDTFIRRFDDIGYITSTSDYGDRVFDASGAVFLTSLSRNGQTLEELFAKIAQSFKGVDIETLKKDVAEFYAMLEEDGFIVSGETEAELNRKDTRFSYSDLKPKTIKENFAPDIKRVKKTSQEFLEEHFRDRQFLTYFQIELTSRCNERCVHCYIPHENKTADIEKNLFYDTLDQCRDMGIINLTLSGGEPMLHPKFREFLCKAKEYDFSITILSNLTLLDDKIISEMKASHLSSVQVSLYSMKSEIHDAITQVKGSFEKTRDAILRLIENDIPLHISCPAMKLNKNCLADVLIWAREHKVRVVSDYIMMARYDRNTSNLDNRLSLEETGQLINDIIENNMDYRAEILNADIVVTENRDTSNDIVCGAGISSSCMSSGGNVYPCSGWQGYICGNLHEQSLKDIWENSLKLKYLRGLRKKDFPKCLSCADKSFCAMCMVRNSNENPDGDPLKINGHFCKVAALNRKIVLDWKEKIQTEINQKGGNMAYDKSAPSIAKKLGFDLNKDIILSRKMGEKLKPLCETCATKSISKMTLKAASCTFQHELSGSPPAVYDEESTKCDNELWVKIVDAMWDSIECARAAGVFVTYEKLLSAISGLPPTITGF